MIDTKFFLAIAVTAFLIGCAPLRVKHEVVLPAREDGLLHARRVAVLDIEQERRSFFSHDVARGVRAEIEAILGDVRTGGQRQFDLVERARLDAVTGELRRSHGSPFFDDQSAVKLGRLVGADTVLMGMLGSPTTDRRQYTATSQECGSYDKDGKCRQWYTRSHYCTHTAVSFKLTLRAVSVETGRIVFAKTYPGTAEDDSCNSRASSASLESRALGGILGEVRRDLVAHKEVMALEIMEKPDAALKDNREARKLFESGVEFAKARRMDRACELFSRALAQNADSPVLFYNAGVCAEVEGNLDKAQVFYRRADRMSASPVRQYGEALARIQQRLDAAGKLRDSDDVLR